MQGTAPRTMVAVVFVSLTLAHEIFLSVYDGLLYYGSAALFDAAIIITISGIRPLPKLVLDLHRVCVVSILTNFLGWCAWYFYMPPGAYNTAFLFLYTWAFMVLITKGSPDVGSNAMDSRGFGFFSYSDTSAIYRRKNEGGA